MLRVIGSRSALGFRVYFIELLLDEVLLVVNFALPVVIVFVEIFVVVLRLNHIEVDLFLILLLAPTHEFDDALHVSHELELVLE